MSTKMDYDVLVVGAGPVGLMLATELQLAGVRVVVVERRTELDTAIKAGGINTASAEAFERRGLLPTLEAVEGQAGGAEAAAFRRALRWDSGSSRSRRRGGSQPARPWPSLVCASPAGRGGADPR